MLVILINDISTDPKDPNGQQVSPSVVLVRSEGLMAITGCHGSPRDAKNLQGLQRVGQGLPNAHKNV